MYLVLVLSLQTIFLLIYYLIIRKYSYWKNQNVPYIKPKFPYGNIKTMNSSVHSAFVMQKIYNDMKGKGPIAGLYFLLSPGAIILDLEMIKTVLVKDFQYFMNHGAYYNEKDDPISAHLFNLENQKWRNLRAKLTPTFTSGKIKFMFSTILSVSDEFKKCISNEIETKSNEIEMKDILARFTTDMIGTCAFGIECNSLKDPLIDFRQKGQKVFDQPKNSGIKQIILNTFPELARKLHFKAVHDDVSTFFTQIVQETVSYREKNNIKRNDFMNLLLQLKNKGKLDDDDQDIEDKINKNNDDRITMAELTAQSYIFFLAGFETSSTAMSYSLYELALNNDIQNRARDEIMKVLQKYNNEWSYDAVMELKYIEQIVNESLRKYPPVANLFRAVTKDYNTSDKKISFKKGMKIMIPTYAIHHDPEYYPNPSEFDPDRFTDEAIRKRNSYTFLPFGEGPRICIGLRFGMLQSKIGLATLLQHFKFSVCSKTVKELEFYPKVFILTSIGGLWLKVEKI